MKHSKKRLGILCVGMAVVLVSACKNNDDTRHRAKETPVEENIDALFQSVIDGLQAMENLDTLQRSAGPQDDSTDPPSYVVTYQGCMSGYFAGTICLEGGEQVIEVVEADTHIIRELQQAEVFDGFSSVEYFTIDGRLEAQVEVQIDPSSHETSIGGTATGALTVRGRLKGSVDVALEISGGRNYTERTSTPVMLEGTFTFDGTEYPVEGGFQRE